jgi:hypothetical protein
VVQLLLKAGAGVNLRWGEYGNAVQLAATEIVRFYKLADLGAEVLECLVLHGAKIDPPNAEWVNWLEILSKEGTKFQRSSSRALDALQRICGDLSRAGRFTESNIKDYMGELYEVLREIAKEWNDAEDIHSKRWWIPAGRATIQEWVG